MGLAPNIGSRKGKTEGESSSSPRTIETFTIGFDNIENNGAVLSMQWDDTYVGVEFEVPTKKKVMASIENKLSGPSLIEYYTAASYYYEEDLDMVQAREWINNAVSLDEEGSYWVLKSQYLIYDKLGDKKNAIAIAKKSLAAAENVDNYAEAGLIRGQLYDWGFDYDEIYCCSNHADKWNI